MNHFSLQSIESLMERETWLGINPNLTITKRIAATDAVSVNNDFNDSNGTKNGKEKLKENGFCKLKLDCGLDELLDRIVCGIETLLLQGYHPNWILVYDEPWIVRERLVQDLSPSVTSNLTIGDWFFFKVNQQQASRSSYLSAFNEKYQPGPPHRDRPKGSSVDSFSPEGHPFYCSIWLALTEATVENSCLHFLPKGLDAGYHAEGDAIPPQTLLDDKGVSQALKKGEYLLFSHRALHWASPPGQNSLIKDRIALTFAMADSGFEKGYFDSAVHLPLPALQLRVSLIAGQMIQYEHLVGGMSKNEVALYRRIFAKGRVGMGFTDAYYEKIMLLAQYLIYLKSQQIKS